jgi:hypothetical protein
MFKSFFSKDKNIQFTCGEELWDVIPKPYPSRKYIPDWFKALPMNLGPEQDVTDHFDNRTIKQCVPFLDAMTAGYIIPLAADVEFQTNSDASGVDWFSKFKYSVIEQHGKNQITTAKSPNPMDHMPPLKFINFWKIKTPPGWSTLFLPPLNRPDPRFVCYSGLVDTDNYDNIVNFPFFFTQPNFLGILKAGTPLIQAIPIKRESLKAVTRAMTDEESDAMVRLQNRMNHQKGLYRDELVEKK